MTLSLDKLNPFELEWLRMVSKAIHLGHQLDSATLEALADFICGDGEAYPVYRSSSYLTRFFQDLGIDVTHDGSTRKWWVLGVLKSLTPNQIESVILRLVDLREYKADKDLFKLAFQTMNTVLAMDNLGITFENNRPILKRGEPIKIDESELLAPTPSKDEEDFLGKQFEEEINISELGLEALVSDVLQERVEEIRACPRDKVALGTIFLLGSTLEGVLHAIAFSQASRFADSPAAPKNKENNRTLPIQDWRLASLIDVSYDLGLIDLDVKKHSHTLRDFRNFIHPYHQLSYKFSPDQHTADICWQVFKAALAQLKRNVGR